MDSILTVHDPRLVALYDGLKQRRDPWRASAFGWAPRGWPRLDCSNVIGMVPGSDPVLKDTYVIVSAHYDHVGIGQSVNGDQHLQWRE
jgi:hypothetical protein